ncbi:hypothetical protein BGX34_009912 [Mortierella sp. NVP85]|nr:hypothetical protein BGX34_009912 [Mortierella sp. NVP85]
MENATQGMLEMNDRPKDGLETAGIGFTLPTPMVQELEQDSPVLSRHELPSPIQPESPIDIFDSISSSAIGELERSTEMMDSSTERERSVHTDNHKDVREEGDGYHGQYAMEMTQDDGQEDETAALQVERAEHRIEDIQKHPTGSSMFGSDPMQDGVAVSRRPSSSNSGGFQEDNGRRLVPVSMGPYGLIRPSAKDNDLSTVGGMDASRPQSPLTSSPPKGLGGFQTAFTISEAVLEKTAKLIQNVDDLLRMAPQYQDQAKALTTTSSLYDQAGSSATAAGSTATQTCTGFKTGKVIPLATSRAACGRAEDDFFAEDDMDDLGIPNTPEHVKTVSSLQPAQFKDFRLASGEKSHLRRASSVLWKIQTAIMQEVWADNTRLEGEKVVIPYTTRTSVVFYWSLRCGTSTASYLTPPPPTLHPPVVWTTQIQSISAEGGLVPGLDVVILRKYPVIFIEMLEDGVTSSAQSGKNTERLRPITSHLQSDIKTYFAKLRRSLKEGRFQAILHILKDLGHGTNVTDFETSDALKVASLDALTVLCTHCPDMTRTIETALSPKYYYDTSSLLYVTRWTCPECGKSAGVASHSAQDRLKNHEKLELEFLDPFKRLIPKCISPESLALLQGLSRAFCHLDLANVDLGPWALDLGKFVLRQLHDSDSALRTAAGEIVERIAEMAAPALLDDPLRNSSLDDRLASIYGTITKDSSRKNLDAVLNLCRRIMRHLPEDHATYNDVLLAIIDQLFSERDVNGAGFILGQASPITGSFSLHMEIVNAYVIDMLSSNQDRWLESFYRWTGYSRMRYFQQNIQDLIPKMILSQRQSLIGKAAMVSKEKLGEICINNVDHILATV